MASGTIDKNSIICGHCKWIKSKGNCWECDNPESSLFEHTVLYPADGCEVYEQYGRIKRNTSIARELLKSVQKYLDREWIGNTETGRSVRRYKKYSKSFQNEPTTYGYSECKKISDPESAVETFDEAADYMLPVESNVQENRMLKKKGFDDIFSGLGQTFQEKLLSTIDAKGMTDAQVYTKANLDRRLFSKIRCNKNYKPSKSTVLALAIALNLNLDETTDLLQRAGLALSPSSKADLIVKYCILNRIYDILDVNAILYEYDQQLLGY